MTKGELEQSVQSDGRPVFGLFAWSPYTVDIVTIGAVSPATRAAVELRQPIAVLMRWHDDWRGPLDALQRRIDDARNRRAPAGARA